MELFKNKIWLVAFISIAVILVAICVGPQIKMVSISAAETMSAESFQAMTPYGVPQTAGTESVLKKRPALWWGATMKPSTPGTVTFASYNNQSSFNIACVPSIVATPYSLNQDEFRTGYEVIIKTVTYAGFTYEVRGNVQGDVTDQTSNIGINWVAIGWI